MPFGYMTSTELLNSIKKRAAVPISQITLSEDDLLAFANEEIQLKVLPNVLATREEFYVTVDTIPIVAGKSNYPIPYRAIGSKVRHVFFQQTLGYLLPLAHIPIEHIQNYQANNFPYQYAGFYVQNNEINLAPAVNSGGTGSLLLRYYFRPNNIVKVSRTALITAIDTVTGQITVDSVPTNITAGSTLDLIQAKPNHKTLNFDITAVSVNSITKVITLDIADIPEDMVVGDYICTAGETPIPQIPTDLHPMVAQCVACRVLESLGATQELANATAKLQEMEQKLLNLIDNRVEAPARKAVNNTSLLMKGKLYRRRYF